MKTYKIIWKNGSTSQLFEEISQVFAEISQAEQEIDKIYLIFSQNDVYFELELT